MSETSNGHQKWGDWFFDYGVFGTEGLCLVDEFPRPPDVQQAQLAGYPGEVSDRRILGRGVSGLPWRVACGPYNDQITWDLEDFGENLNPISGPHHLKKLVTPEGDRYIAIQPLVINGILHLQLAVYARIGAYRIMQTWRLNNDGLIKARVFSKGLSCNLDHWHHPYWRLDFALGSPATHRVAVFHKNGPEITTINNECPVVNVSFSSPHPEYVITSTQPRPNVGRIESPAQAIVTPPQINHHEGIVEPTTFSPYDGYVRIFRPEEDRSWPHAAKDDIHFTVHEPCSDKDIVFWSICHLHHHASEGEDHWHEVGPDILFKPMLVADVPPEYLRVIDIIGELHVKNFKLVGKDQWKHSTFAEQILVNPNVPSGEVVSKLGAGDVTGELILRITWNSDASVNLQFTANLFDEAERVARVEGQFNVFRDTVVKWGGIHLVDHHGGDPDTADMSFEVSNVQQ